MKNRLLACLGLFCLPTDQVPQSRTAQYALFRLEVPAHWRELTPDDTFALGDGLPYSMRSVIPQHLFALGDVDRWRAEGFDGRALTVQVSDGEIPIDEASIVRIREHAADPDRKGPRRSIDSAEIITVGPNAHPAIHCRVTTFAEDEFPPSKSDEYYIPTSGNLLILGFRSWDDEFGSSVEQFDVMIGTATFPRPPRGAEELSDRVTRAIFFGALVGLGLIVLRFMRRRPEPT